MHLLLISFSIVLFFDGGLCFSFRIIHQTPQAVPVDGYIPHYEKDCPGHDFIGGKRTPSELACKQICDQHAMCVAFHFLQGRTHNCWPKSRCDNVKSAVYRRTVLYRKELITGCKFDATPEHALYGENAVVLTNVQLEGCKNKCVWDQKCLSFDYSQKKNTCFISHESKETSEFFGEHVELTYYQKRCGTDVAPVSGDILHASEGSVVTIKDGHCIQTFGPYGGTSGTAFTRKDNMFQNITSITLTHGTYINSLKVQYGTETGTTYGRYGRRTSVVSLRPGEYITEVQGRTGSLVDQLSFKTNQRRFGPFGSTGGIPFRAYADGKPLMYISGIYGSKISAIALHFPC